MMKRNKYTLGLLGCLLFLVINILGSSLTYKVDLTEDKRYTLSAEALTAISQINSPVTIDVLLGGELPPEFTRLRREINQILKEFTAENSQLSFNIVDPLENEEDNEVIIAELQAFGLTPANITIEENSKVSQEIFFPWAI
ncbi:MAG: Gldg family protein, partial [Eudoraea sp.]